MYVVKGCERKLTLREWNKLWGKLMVYIGELITIYGIVYWNTVPVIPPVAIITGLILVIYGGIAHELNERDVAKNGPSD